MWEFVALVKDKQENDVHREPKTILTSHRFMMQKPPFHPGFVSFECCVKASETENEEGLPETEAADCGKLRCLCYCRGSSSSQKKTCDCVSQERANIFMCKCTSAKLFVYFASISSSYINGFWIRMWRSALANAFGYFLAYMFGLDARL